MLLTKKTIIKKVPIASDRNLKQFDRSCSGMKKTTMNSEGAGDEIVICNIY